MAVGMVLAAIFLCCFCAAFVHGSLKNCIGWPRYVTSEDTVLCSCYYSSVYQAPSYLQWKNSEGGVVAQGPPGQKSLDLTLDSLNWTGRDAGGKTFTCFKVSRGSSRNVSLGSYTPYFAYGPDDVTVTSDKAYMPTDGSKMTLTCSANVNPQPRFQWKGQPPEAVIGSGCRCGNDTFSQTLTFDTQGLWEGYVIHCRVTVSVTEWRKTDSNLFILHIQPDRPQPISLQQHVAVTVTLAAIVLASWLLLFIQCRKIRKLTREKNNDGPNPYWRAETEPFLDSMSTYASTGYSGNSRFLNPEICSIQSDGI